MNKNIHKFHYKDIYFLLDVNSGAVHVIDKIISDVMDIFEGSNDEEVINKLTGKYEAADLKEALGELHELAAAGQLFAPDIDVPPVFSDKGIVKSMCLLVAHDCNLRCKYCFADSGEFGADRRLMKNEVGEAAVEYIIKHSGNRKHCEIDFFGGEPLVNMPVVKHITKYVRKREQETGKVFKLTLTTNGMLLTDENIAFLNDNNISAVISLDGRKEVHDRMRPDAGGLHDADHGREIHELQHPKRPRSGRRTGPRPHRRGHRPGRARRGGPAGGGQRDGTHERPLHPRRAGPDDGHARHVRPRHRLRGRELRHRVIVAHRAARRTQHPAPGARGGPGTAHGGIPGLHGMRHPPFADARRPARLAADHPRSHRHMPQTGAAGRGFQHRKCRGGACGAGRRLPDTFRHHADDVPVRQPGRAHRLHPRPRAAHVGHGRGKRRRPYGRGIGSLSAVGDARLETG